MKKLMIVIICLLAVTAVAIVAVGLLARKSMKEIEAEYVRIGPVNLAEIPDGVYNGSSGSIPVFVNLDITIRKHRIEEILIVKQRSGKGYQARETVDRIRAAQQPKVDAITGATLSSKCIMVAASNALASATAK